MMSGVKELLDDFVLSSKNILYDNDNLIGIYLYGSLDKDLAAHFTIIYHRGKTLCGKEIKSVFSEVSSGDYLDSIWLDVKNAKEDIVDDTMYIIPNLCRVLAYKKERLILSKQEGGEWALHRLSDPQYKKMVLLALEEYKTGNTMSITQADAVRFAEYMLKHIGDK